MASAVPLYQVSPRRCWAGTTSTYSPRFAARKPQPRSTWRIRLCALYCVSTAMRRMPEFTQLLSAKSMILSLPAKGTAGLARRSVSCFRREPRPPASTMARVCCDRWSERTAPWRSVRAR
jgi:hypothetical protein